jgi:hypothetical protein
MSVEAAAQDRVKCLLTIKRTSAHHRVKPPLTITEMRRHVANVPNSDISDSKSGTTFRSIEHPTDTTLSAGMA